MSDKQIEQGTMANVLAAPRITLDDIEANIVSEHYFTAGQGDAKAVEDAAFSGGALNAAASRATPAALNLLTYCVLVLRNGTKITGINYGAIDPAQHCEARGRKEARAHAIEQIWPLMGYALRQRIHDAHHGVDALLATRIPILDQITDLCHAIEKCGASPELPDAVTKASALRGPISDLVKQAIDLGLDTGCMSVSGSLAAHVS